MKNQNPVPLRLKVPAVIPGLENYPGCKGAAGVYQNIISHIPKCERLIIPFLGHCAIARNIKRPRLMILNDIDERVYYAWRDALIKSGFTIDKEDADLITYFRDAADGSAIILSCMDAAALIENLDHNKPTSIYCDPPYPFESRKKTARIYRHESEPELHVDLLSSLLEVSAKVVISTYDNDMYRAYLHTWSHHQFTGMTHGGAATETIFYNFSLSAIDLQDYRYLGKNYKDRERIRLKTKRHVTKFRKLPMLERKAILNELIENFK